MGSSRDGDDTPQRYKHVQITSCVDKATKVTLSCTYNLYFKVKKVFQFISRFCTSPTKSSGSSPKPSNKVMKLPCLPWHTQHTTTPLKIEGKGCTNLKSSGNIVENFCQQHQFASPRDAWHHKRTTVFRNAAKIFPFSQKYQNLTYVFRLSQSMVSSKLKVRVEDEGETERGQRKDEVEYKRPLLSNVQC